MAPHPVAKDKSLAMIGLSWLADLPASEVREGGKRQPDDILQPFNTVACVTQPRTMPQTQTQTARRRQTGCLSSSLSPESVASKQKTISRKLTEILQCCFIIISRWGHRTEKSRAEQSRGMCYSRVAPLVPFGCLPRYLGLTTCCALIMSPSLYASFEILRCNREREREN